LGKKGFPKATEQLIKLPYKQKTKSPPATKTASSRLKSNYKSSQTGKLKPPGVKRNETPMLKANLPEKQCVKPSKSNCFPTCLLF